MQKWEYLNIHSFSDNKPGQEVFGINSKETVKNQRPELYSYLNKLGDDGWEIVGFHVYTSFEYYYVLKRPIEE